MPRSKDLVRLWNSTLIHDPTTETVLKFKFLNSRFLKKVSPWLNGEAFSLAGVRSHDFYGEIDPNTGWILGLGFKNQGDMRNLFARQIESFKRQGVSSLFYSSFTPNYFFPGVDRHAYPEVLDFLEQNGFVQQEEVIAMHLDLMDYKIRSAQHPQGVITGPITQKLRPYFYEFLRKNFSADWYYRARNAALFGEADQITVARTLEGIVGFSMFSGSEGPTWYAPGERFGPFGVSESHRGRGIGSILLESTLNTMKGRGIRTAFFMWTEENAARLYKRFGFKETRRFSIMKMDLS